MSREQYAASAEDEKKKSRIKEFLRKWGKPFALVAIGLVGLSWLL